MNNYNITKITLGLLLCFSSFLHAHFFSFLTNRDVQIPEYVKYGAAVALGFSSMFLIHKHCMAKVVLAHRIHEAQTQEKLKKNSSRNNKIKS